MAVFAGFQADVMARTADPDEAESAGDYVALFTPLIKSFLSDLGLQGAIEAQQVYGGHGYVREHGMEQLVRDARITQIYEGTNEVQAVDLARRKLTLHDGRLVRRLFERWDRLFESLENDARLKWALSPTRQAVKRLQAATEWMVEQLQGDEAAALASATDFQRQFALTAIAGFWLEICSLLTDRDDAMAGEKRALARVYFAQVLPETLGLHKQVISGADAISAISLMDE
jgi:hypothetical protein